MKGDVINFILQNELSPFNLGKTAVKRNGDNIFKTKDASAVQTKTVKKLSSNFVFAETSGLWSFFGYTNDFNDILRRQEFFRNVSRGDNSFLKKLVKPRQSWSPKYDIVVVTEEEDTFVRLQKLNCAVSLLVNENDLSDLERYDIVQVVDCDMFKGVLESLPQSVFIDNVENVYLERYLEELSAWSENFAILNGERVGDDVREILEGLSPLFDLIDVKANKILTIEESEGVLEDINEKISEKVKELTISGLELMKMLSENKMPAEFKKIIENALDGSGLPHHIFNFKIPVELDYAELEKEIKRRSANEFTNLAEAVKRKAEELKQIPKRLKMLQANLILEDFMLGLSGYLKNELAYPSLSDNLHFTNAKNLFLVNAQPIDFQLDNFSKCSILTGANSGGKTTLIEHILQNITFAQFGLPISGEVHLPMFSDIYYFAKNKGSASKGAFETLLTQMSQINPGNRTLILADEIEAVTEPGVAGKIIASTADFFIQKNCYLVIATHLGYEIQECLPEGARIDGIEATGLDKEFNLIVNHNPVMGRLAHSTPELIVERMANAYDKEYFRFLNENLKK